MPSSTLIPILVRPEDPVQRPRRQHEQPAFVFRASTMRPTAVLGEVWYTTAPRIRVTSLLGEVWYTANPKMRATQVVAEIWMQVPPRSPSRPSWQPSDEFVHKSKPPVHSDPAFVFPYTVPFVAGFPYRALDENRGPRRRPRDEAPTFFVSAAAPVGFTPPPYVCLIE